MPPSALLCDLDGTLVDSFADIRKGILRALAAVGGEPSEPLVSLATRGISLEAFYARAFGVAPGDPGERDRLDRFVDCYRRDYFVDFQSRPYDGVVEALTEVKQRFPSMPIAVATTKRTGMATEVARRCGLSSLVDRVIGSDGLPKKPDPTLLRVACEHVGADVSLAMMVGDTDNDIGAAKAAGCVSIGVTYGGFGAAEMRALSPDHVLDSFARIVELMGSA